MPTPVSSLLHAATLVIAGIYIIIRSNFIFNYSNELYLYIGFIGSITCIIASIIGIFQTDLKRIIAYSTISQMGYLYIISSIGMYNVCIYHIINHAFFKSLLFICAGIVIHTVSDVQDIRSYGGFRFILPVMYISIFIGSVALIAIPGTSGYYSKDVIIELISYNYNINHTIYYYMSVLAAFNTALYSTKILILVFNYYPNTNYNSYINVHSTSNVLYIPLIILSILSIVFGYFLSDIYTGIGSNVFNNTVYMYNNSTYFDFELNYSVFTKFIPFFFTILGITTSIYIYSINNYTINKIFYNYNNIYKYMVNNLYIDHIYNKYMLNTGFNISYNIYKYIDVGFIEYIGPIGVKYNILGYNSIYNNSYYESSSFINTFIYYNVYFMFISIIYVFVSILIIPFNIVIYGTILSFIIYSYNSI